MRIFAIGDMHLAGGTDKTMDRFGDHWRNHDRKIFESWENLVSTDDLVLICGDTSWAMRLDQAAPDLARIGQMPGRKILIRGNHDYWWETQAKLTRSLDGSITSLNGTSVIIDRIAIAGTRGWLCPNDVYFQPHDRKIYEREVNRLRSALDSLKSRRSEFDVLIVALHYPPVNQSHEPSDFLSVIRESRADYCVYGHLHGEDIKIALSGELEGTTYRLVSADAVHFKPYELGA